MKKVLSLVLSLVMLLSLVVPVSAEDTIFEGNGTLKDKTVAFTIEADKTTLYGESRSSSSTSMRRAWTTCPSGRSSLRWCRRQT